MASKINFYGERGPCATQYARLTSVLTSDVSHLSICRVHQAKIEN